MFWGYKSDNELVKKYWSSVQEYYKDRSADIISRELHVTSEILKRDFTKRQQKIILLIATLSYPFNKDSALIPNVQDFCMCGVGVSKVRGEIEKLVGLKVICHIEDQNMYSINDPMDWEVPFHQHFVSSRAEELFMINVAHAGYDVSAVKKRIAEFKNQR